MSVTHNSATLSWTAPTEGDVDGYEYYVSDVNTPPSSGTSTSNVSVGLTGLTSGTIYYYWVRTKGCGSDLAIGRVWVHLQPIVKRLY